MQAISPQEVMANSPRLCARLTIVDFGLSDMRWIVIIDTRCGKNLIVAADRRFGILVRMNLEERVIAKSLIDGRWVLTSRLVVSHSQNTQFGVSLSGWRVVREERG